MINELQLPVDAPLPQQKNSFMKSLIVILLFISTFTLSTSAQDSLLNKRKWAFEVNALWPIFPGNIYSARFVRQVYANNQTAGDVYLGFAHKPYEFRNTEGEFSNSAIVFGYRQYIWKGLNAEFYNAIGPGRIRNSVVNGKDYRSTDYELAMLLGYRIHFLKSKRTPLYINLMPVGFAYVAYQSNPHPIVGQTEERPIYFGKVQIGLRF